MVTVLRKAPTWAPPTAPPTSLLVAEDVDAASIDTAPASVSTLVRAAPEVPAT